MCASKNSRLINSHVQNFVQAVFSDKLREEGFTSLENRDICWLRIKNGSLVNSLCFSSQWDKLPVFLHASYGIYPLFSELYLPTRVHDPNRPYDERMNTRSITGIGYYGSAPYAPNANVEVSRYDGYGMDTFNREILPEYNRINTITDCYLAQKDKHQKGIREYKEKYLCGNISEIFIDMAIYLDDTDLDSYCKKRLDLLIDWRTEDVRNYPKRTDYAQELERLKLLKTALYNNARDDYLKILEQRKQKNISLLQKKYGIIAP